MWLKTQARGPPASLPCRPGMKKLGAEEEKESSITLRKECENLILTILRRAAISRNDSCLCVHTHTHIYIYIYIYIYRIFILKIISKYLPVG